MGVESGRRFLKQPAAKLEPAIAELSQLILRDEYLTYPVG